MSVCYRHYSFFFIAASISRGFILLVCQLPLAPVRGLIPCHDQQQQVFNALDTLYFRGMEEKRVGMSGYSMVLWVFSRALCPVPL